MGSHRTTIKRKKPLTQAQSIKSIKRRDAIRSLHSQMKSSQALSVPLSLYQNASSKGQDVHRGGDSSRELVKWLGDECPSDFRVLEIGCLEADNAIAKYVQKHQKSIRRIDLKSRDPRIEEQDFMTLTVPQEVSTFYVKLMQKYDLISLSLVLNFVPTPQGRYDMLKRTTLFLRDPATYHNIYPALFVVLPLPCVSNSRYLPRDHFLDIMKSLGYSLFRTKESKRMAYWLFCWTGNVEEREWKKKVINEGKGRNNFAICT